MYCNDLDRPWQRLDDRSTFCFAVCFAMDSWLKAAREQAAKIGEDIQKQAILLADDAGQKGKREISFGEGPLGFELDGNLAFLYLLIWR